MRSAPPGQDPAPLHELRRLYDLVPARVDIKFQLVPGQRFLSDLHRIAGRYPVTEIAAALGVTPTTVYAMRRHPIGPDAKRWPTDREMATINRAWAKVKGRGYHSAEHLAMHRALQALLSEGFVVIVVARRLKIPVVTLERFVKPPVGRGRWPGGCSGP